MRGRIKRRNKVAHPLEFLGHRSQLGAVAVRQGDGQPGRKADARPLDDRRELAQTGRARMITELRGGLQADHFGCELPVARAVSAAVNKVAIRNLVTVCRLAACPTLT